MSGEKKYTQHTMKTSQHNMKKPTSHYVKENVLVTISREMY